MKNLKQFRRKLQSWYHRHGRHDLPWRTTRDAYAIWISEVMLQQTQVATIRDRFYAPFLKRFPNIQTLARAPLEDVLKAWQGMGYYRRARNLHIAAQQAGRALPKTIEGLLALPGIGKNTAHAIAAFAYGTAVPVMEANVKRVIARIFALAAPGEKILWEHAHTLLDTLRSFDYNQSMMDLGALICTPRAPLCPACPAQKICRGKASPERYPKPKKRANVPVRKIHIVLAQNTRGEIYCEQRTEEFLHGLYRFLETPTPPKLPWKSATLKPIGAFTHRYSHFELRAKVWRAEGIKQSGSRWKSLHEMKKLPLSKAEIKTLKILDAQKNAGALKNRGLK